VALKAGIFQIFDDYLEISLCDYRMAILFLGHSAKSCALFCLYPLLSFYNVLDLNCYVSYWMTRHAGIYDMKWRDKDYHVDRVAMAEKD
jgi:hypothetical protein